MGNGKCRIHGGLTPTGIAHPNFKTGRYSKYLPAHILLDFQSAKTDPELVECRHELALIDSRMAQLAQRLQSGTDGELWTMLGWSFDTLATNFDSLVTEIKNDSLELRATAASLEDCRKVINDVRASDISWKEIYALLEQRRKLVETESKRLKDMQQMMTSEQAALLISAVAEVIKENVTDTAQRRRISEGITNLVVGRFGKAA